MLSMDVSPIAGRPILPIFEQLKSNDEVKEKAKLSVATHRREDAEFSRSVLLSARGWWRELLSAQESSGYTSRPLKLFACDETDGVRKFVCTFISPLCSVTDHSSFPLPLSFFFNMMPFKTHYFPPCSNQSLFLFLFFVSFFVLANILK